MVMTSQTTGCRYSAEKNTSHWSQNLLKSIKDPKMIYEKDDMTTTIKDLYPKAKHHFLVCPKEFIPNLESVQKKHLSLLKHMHEVALKISQKHEGKKFLIGYHSIPSMNLLHLHVISDDFDSPCLKTKKHWNSFTTEYFIPSERVIKELEENGELTKRKTSELKNFLETSLKCFKCDHKPKNMPKLKQHLKTHLNE